MLKVTLCMLLVGFSSAVVDESLHRRSYPNPILNPGACGTGSQPSWVCDPHSVLGDKRMEALKALNMTVHEIWESSNCPCSAKTCKDAKDNKGFPIGIALVNRMEPDQNDNQETLATPDGKLLQARLYAYTLMDNWGLGKCDEAALIFYSLSDNVMYTITGETARKALTDDAVGEILNNEMLAMFQDPETGLNQVLESFRSVVVGTFQSRDVRSADYQMPFSPLQSGAGVSLPFMMANLLLMTGLAVFFQ